MQTTTSCRGARARLRPLPWLALGPCVALLACAGPTADSPSTASRPIYYGADGQKEYYESTSDLWRGLTRNSAVALLDETSLDETNPASIRVFGPTMREWGVCGDTHYVDERQIAYCSGMLIDDDLVLTAGHCVPDQETCDVSRFVFRLYYESAGQLATITSDDVFKCKRVAVQAFDDTSDYDYAIVQLDRAATPRFTPAAIAAPTAPLHAGTPVTVIGFPLGIPAKIALGGQVVDGGDSSLESFDSTIDVFSGNSGSPILDAEGRILGILVSGSEDFVRNGRTCRAVDVLADDGSEGAETSCYVGNAVDALCAAHWPSMRLCNTAPRCGDGICSAGETQPSCPVDCPLTICGDGVCEPGESIASCAADCDVFHCGDGVCESGEDCRQDCPPTIPAGWTCPAAWYQDYTYCDCDCGAPDPDCADTETVLTGCASDTASCRAGVCVEPGADGGVSVDGGVPDAGYVTELPQADAGTFRPPNAPGGCGVGGEGASWLFALGLLALVARLGRRRASR